MKVTRGVVSPDGRWIGVRVTCTPVMWTTSVPRETWSSMTEAECEVKARDYMVRRGFKEAAFDYGC